MPHLFRRKSEPCQTHKIIVGCSRSFCIRCLTKFRCERANRDGVSASNGNGGTRERYARLPSALSRRNADNRRVIRNISSRCSIRFGCKIMRKTRQQNNLCRDRAERRFRARKIASNNSVLICFACESKQRTTNEIRRARHKRTSHEMTQMRAQNR